MTFLWVLFVTVMNLILLPVRAVSRLFAKTYPAYATYRIIWGPGRCHIGSELDTSIVDHDTVLIGSYLAFLFRYFYICDPRQRAVVRDYLVENLPDMGDDIYLLSIELFDAVMSQYPKPHQQAAKQMFNGIPPGADGYSETGVPVKVLARYSLRVTTGFRSHFDMSAGSDRVLLPQMTLLFYRYVADKLHDPEGKTVLERLVQQALTSQTQWNPGEMRTMLEGPAELLRRNHLIT